MNIVVTELPNGRFAARVGSRVLRASRTPFLSAARALERDGVAADTSITLSHAGSEVVSLRSTVGAAAKLTVVENDRDGPRLARYQAFPSGMHRIGAAEGSGRANGSRMADGSSPSRTAEIGPYPTAFPEVAHG